MAVPIKQSVPINFAGGLDRKTDPFQVGPESFLTLNNSVFTTGERITKRNGFAGYPTTVSTPSTITTYSTVPANLNAARKVFSYNNELLVNDAWNLYSYDFNALAWNYRGRSTVVALETHNIAVGGGKEFSACDSSTDTTSNVRVVAYQSAAGVGFSIVDVATGQLVITGTMGATTFINPSCVSIPGKSWVFAVNTADGKLYYQAIVGQTVTGSPTALITDLNTTNRFYDVDVDPNTGNIYVAYFNSSPGITISALSTSMVVGNTITKAESATHGVSFFGDGTHIWVVYNDGTATKGFIVNNAVTATTVGPTTIDSSATSTNVLNVTGVYSPLFGVAFIFYDQVTTTGAGPFYTSSAVINFNTAFITGATMTVGINVLPLMGSVNINSKAFLQGGVPHIVGLYTYPTKAGILTEVVQSTNFLLNIYNLTAAMNGAANSDVAGNIAAKISPDEAQLTANGIDPILGSRTGHMASVHQVSSGVWDLALLQNVTYGTNSQASITLFAPTGVIDCQFNFNLSNPDVQSLGNNALMAGGQVSMYDGLNLVEQNFHIYPNAFTATPGSGGSLSVGTYGYVYTYEWIDNQGQVHRSFPSPVMSAVFVAGSGKTTLTVPYLRVTNKGGSAVVVNIYRTTANGSVYYLLPFNVGQFGNIINDPTQDSVSFVDTIPDLLLSAQIQLYTTGAQGYFAPPATAALTNFKNRAIAVPYEGGFDFLYSNAVLQNFPVQFVPYFDQNIGSVGGPIVAIAQMDDKMILFKRGDQSGPAIYYMVGNGPAPSGTNNDFQDPLPVAVDAGLADRPSIVLTPVGLMFKSIKGIYLLDRGMTASYIGAPVEAYNQYNVVSAQLIPNTTQVRYLLSNGTLLMYDYFYKCWGTFSNPAGISDCIFQGQHTYVSSTGQVYQESPGTSVDGTSTPILINFTTAWIKLAGLQGYQRSFFFYLLAEYLSAHQLQLQIAYDFASSPSQTTIITPRTDDSLENWRVFLAKQRCQSFQITLQEIFTGTNGPAFTMSGLNLIVGAKSKFRTISAAESVG